jgi:hypothetical protein
MFKLAPNPSFPVKVLVHVPGQGRTQPFEVEFRHMSQSSLQQFLEEVRGKKDAEAIDALASIIVGWDGVAGADGAPVPFSRAALATMIDLFPSAAQALFTAYAEELAGARLGN